MAEYRTHMKIIGDILATTRDDLQDESGASVTYLIRKANISHSQGPVQPLEGEQGSRRCAGTQGHRRRAPHRHEVLHRGSAPRSSQCAGELGLCCEAGAGIRQHYE